MVFFLDDFLLHQHKNGASLIYSVDYWTENYRTVLYKPAFTNILLSIFLTIDINMRSSILVFASLAGILLNIYCLN